MGYITYITQTLEVDMDIYLNINITEGLAYTTTHLTEKGALVSQTQDIIEYLGDQAENSREEWVSCFTDHGVDKCEVLFREDILDWREWTLTEIWKLRDIILELTWDHCDVDWMFETSQLVP